MEMLTLVVIGAATAWALLWANALTKEVRVLKAWAKSLVLVQLSKADVEKIKDTVVVKEGSK